MSVDTLNKVLDFSFFLQYDLDQHSEMSNCYKQEESPLCVLCWWEVGIRWRHAQYLHAFA